MTNSSNDLLVVTGAASGIGRAMVKAAVARGTHVLALDVQDVASELENEHQNAPGKLSFMRCDVSTPEDWKQVAATLKKMGPPTQIHLNAGIQIAPPEAPLSDYEFESMQLDRYRRMMGVNVDGVVFGLQALLPLCQSGTAIVVTSSLAGITPYTVDPLYAMSKHAVSGLVRSLGPILGKRGIKINAICPGGIDTAIIPHAQRTQLDDPENPVDTSSLMTPEHVADEVNYLMTVEETGKTWAKLHQNKPVYIIRAPGDRGPKEQDPRNPRANPSNSS